MKVSDPDLIAVPITLSVPKWMRDYIQETARLKASKIFQDYLKQSGIIRGLHAENQCPDKLEPMEGHIPKEGLRTIRKKLGIEDN